MGVNVAIVLEFIPLLFLAISLYWHDIPSFSCKLTTPTEQLVFLLIVGFLACVSLIERREALRTLSALPGRGWRIALALIACSLLLFILGSYTPQTLWLHFQSMILMGMGYTALIFNPKALRISLPAFLSLASVFPIPPEMLMGGAFSPLIIPSLGTILLLAYVCWFFVAKRPPPTPCSWCEACEAGGEGFCPYCGRQLRPVRLAPTKATVAAVILFSATLLALTAIAIPIQILHDQEVGVEFYSLYGVREEPILPTPEGWRLNASFDGSPPLKPIVPRDSITLLHVYQSEEHEGGRLYILLVAYPPTMREARLNLSQWQETHEFSVVLEGDIHGKYVALLGDDNRTVTLLLWRQRLTFRGPDSTYTRRNIMVAILKAFNEPLNEDEVLHWLDRLREIASSITSTWKLHDRWTRYIMDFDMLLTRLRDPLISATGGFGLLILAGWVRGRDRETGRIVENALHLLEEDPPLLVALSRMKGSGFTGLELLNQYRELGGSASPDDLPERLDVLLSYGLIKRDYVCRGYRPVMVWKRRTP